MATKTTKKELNGKVEPGMPELTDIKVLPKNATLEKAAATTYKYCYTTGPFLLPQNSGSLDWALLNNDTTQQTARITVLKCSIGTAKTPLAPGALLVTLAPGSTTHNANTYTQGFYYEIQVETNSLLMFPYVNVWPANFGVSIPGTGITSGSFIKLMR